MWMLEIRMFYRVIIISFGSGCSDLMWVNLWFSCVVNSGIIRFRNMLSMNWFMVKLLDISS